MPISFDYRLDPPDDPSADEERLAEEDAWIEAHSDITFHGTLSPTDIFIPLSASEYADLYGSDLEEPEDLPPPSWPPSAMTLDDLRQRFITARAHALHFEAEARDLWHALDVAEGRAPVSHAESVESAEEFEV